MSRLSDHENVLCYDDSGNEDNNTIFGNLFWFPVELYFWFQKKKKKKINYNVNVF